MDNNVGVLTYHRAENYGSVLQAYALQKYLYEKLHINTELIDFIPDGQKELYQLYAPIRNPKNVIGNILKMGIAKKYMERRQGFRKFIDENLAVYSVEGGQSVLENLESKYDAIITGSDQIWNPFCRDFSYIYFLENIHGLKKIAYAPSGIGENIPDVARIKKCLLEYDFISVREDIGKEIIENQMGISGVKVCVDPTLLLDREDYEKICAPRRYAGEYIFLYSVYHDDRLLTAIKKISKKIHLPIITMISRANSYKVLFNGMKIADYEAPEDFLSYIKYAKYVFTNSFHGTVFSIIFGKEFYYLGNCGDDPRIRQILGYTNLWNNIVDYSVLEKQMDNFGKNIKKRDYSKIIMQLRKPSEDYLKEALAYE